MTARTGSEPAQASLSPQMSTQNTLRFRLPAFHYRVEPFHLSRPPIGGSGVVCDRRWGAYERVQGFTSQLTQCINKNRTFRGPALAVDRQIEYYADMQQ